MALKLYALTCGWLTLRKAFFLDGEPGHVTVPVPAYLIDHPRGRALFDTGLGLRFRRAAGALQTGVSDLDETTDIGARLRAMNVDPESIRWIINSHMHPDHCGGNVFIPNATVVVQAKEWSYAKSREDKFYDPAEFDTGHLIKEVRGDHDLYGDGSVVLFPSPGHTPGHQCVRVRLPAGDVILAADCCNMRASLDKMWLPDHVHNVEDSLATLRRLSELRASGARIFFGHDPEFWALVPQAQSLA